MSRALTLLLCYFVTFLVSFVIISSCQARHQTEPETILESELVQETVSGMLCELYQEPETTEAPETEAPTEPTTIAETETDPEPAYRTSICGIENPYADILYQALDGYGLSSWYEIGLAQCFQESHFNCLAENVNGLDKGLFQYRLPYWVKTARQAGIEVNEASVYDPHIQCAVYAYYVNLRLSQGMTPDEVISAHYTGGYGYSAEYVAQVRQWVR